MLPGNQRSFPSPSPWQSLIFIPESVSFPEGHINGIMWDITICVWLLSLGIIILRFIHAVACVCHNFFVHLTTKKHIWFFLAFVNYEMKLLKILDRGFSVNMHFFFSWSETININKYVYLTMLKSSNYFKVAVPFFSFT